MSDVALSILLLCTIAALGLGLGGLKIKGISLGVGGVMFSGIAVGHLVHQMGIPINLAPLAFLQEFGLILFVYTIGVQVGPGLFASLKRSGLTLNSLAAAIVALGMLVAAGIHWLAGIPMPAVLGLMAGAVTNTPSLAVAEQTLQTDSNIGLAGLGYAVAYPFGILGILLTMMLIRAALGINIKGEVERFEEQRRAQTPPLDTLDVVIRNANLAGVAMQDVPGLVDQGVVASRLKRGEHMMAPGPDTVLELGDLLHLVGPEPKLKGMQLVLGEKTDIKLTTKNTDLRWEKVVVTNSKVLGESIAELNMQELYQVVISRVIRAGVEIAPTPALQLQFGDILNIVGRPEDIQTVSGMLGNAKHLLQHTQMIPIFFGIALGVLLGSLPIFLPGIPNALKLGLAGGPLLAAIILARIGNIGPLVWFMPPSANLVLREFGIDAALVGIDGEMRAFGLRPDGEAWAIAVEAPEAGVRAPHSILSLHDGAVATSGDYRHTVTVQSHRLSHTMDPRRGAPLASSPASVTVVAPSCAQADAWATALMVLGPEAGMRLAARQGLSVLFLMRDGKGGIAPVASGLFREESPGSPSRIA